MREDKNKTELTPKEAADARIFAAMRASERRQNRGGYLMIALMAAVVLGGGGFELHAHMATPRPAVLTGPLATKVETTNNGGNGSGNNGRTAATAKAPAKTKPTTKAKAKAQPKVKLPHVQTLGSSHGVPNFWAAPKGNIFLDATAINNRYIAWADAKIAQEVPGIAATGPNAGTLTPQIMNSAAILKKYPGPKVPVSLSAAGVKLPAGTPANGAITGLSLTAMQAALKANPWLHVTPQQLMGAYQTAAKFIMANNSNNEISALRYVYPYFSEYNTRLFVENEAPGWATEGGQLQARQVAYQSSVAYDLASAGRVSGAYDLGRDSVSGKQLGDVVANAVILNVHDNIIGTGMVNGRLKVGSFPLTIGSVYVTLIRHGNVERWYVIGAGSISGGSTPNAVYWTAPQGG